MAVKAGAPKPDISTFDAFRRTLMAAKSIAYSDSASGVYVERELFSRLGEPSLAAKARKVEKIPVASTVASLRLSTVAPRPPVRASAIAASMCPTPLASATRSA
mgnify:CR=1 FL=1